MPRQRYAGKNRYWTPRGSRGAFRQYGSQCLSVGSRVPCAVSWRFGITHDVDTHPLFALAQLARHSFRNMDDVMGLSVGSFAEDEA